MSLSEGFSPYVHPSGCIWKANQVLGSEACKRCETNTSLDSQAGQGHAALTALPYDRARRVSFDPDMGLRFLLLVASRHQVTCIFPRTARRGVDPLSHDPQIVEIGPLGKSQYAGPFSQKISPKLVRPVTESDFGEEGDVLNCRPCPCQITSLPCLQTPEPHGGGTKM